MKKSAAKTPAARKPALWRRLARVALVTAALGAPGVANAQSDPGLADLSLEDLMKVKVETVVGASKYRQLVTEAPASVTIISSDEIQRHQCRTLADAMRNVRGFYVTATTGTTTTSARAGSSGRATTTAGCSCWWTDTA